MIVANGIDIVEIPRIKNAIDKWKGRFLNRVFTKKEIEYSKKKKFSCQHFAARFAAKEAVLKALGNQKSQYSLKDIEILNDNAGGPKIILLKNKNCKMEAISISISISHAKEYAVASAIVFR